MKLITKLLLLVTATMAAIVLISIFILNTQVKQYLQTNNNAWLGQTINAVAEGVANDTLHQRSLKVRELLRKILAEGEAIKYLYVTNLNGEIIAHSFYGGFPKALADHYTQSHTEHPLEADNTLSLHWRFRNKGIVISEYKMPLIKGTDFYIYAGISEEKLTQALNKSIQYISIAIVFIGFIGLWIVVIMGRHISQPLDRLTSEIKAFSKGKKLAKFDVRSNDHDINQLADAFNHMVVSRQAAEAAVLEREQRLDLTLDCIGDGIIATDEKGYITRMNPVAEKLCGWEEKDAIGLPLTDVFCIINAHTRETVDNPVFKVIETGKIVGLANHTVLIAKDKHEYQIADSAAPIIDHNNKLHGVILVFRDVTEEYALQENLAFAQRVAHIGSWTLDLLTHELHWSDQVYAIFELDPDTTTPSYDLFLNSIHPDDKDKVSQAYVEAIENKQAYEIQHRLLMPDGRIKTVIEKAETHYDSEGNPLQSLGTIQDITESKALEAQLNRSQKMDALGKLTGGIAHDYNNMLGIVMGYAEILQTQLSDSPVLQKYANEIYLAGERGAKLTRRLLSFSRQQITTASSCFINNILEDNLLMLEKTLTASVQLRLQLDKDLWPVWIDKSDLEDALLNMAINAMHAMEQKGHLTLSTNNVHLDTDQAKRLELPVGDYVCLSVSDTGIGMDAETQAKIFDPFYSSKGDMGTGLGLSQVYGFVQRCKGSIEVISQPREGACFKLYFPRYYNSAADRVAQDKQLDPALGGSETILLVDDEKGLRDLGADILSRVGYTVICKDNGDDAIAYLQQHRVDLLFTDIIMPNMDGYQLAELAQQIQPDIKIQVTSGFSGGLHKTVKNPHLHNHILRKPFSSKALLKAIKNALHGDANNTENS